MSALNRVGRRPRDFPVQGSQLYYDGMASVNIYTMADGGKAVIDEPEIQGYQVDSTATWSRQD